MIHKNDSQKWFIKMTHKNDSQKWFTKNDSQKWFTKIHANDSQKYYDLKKWLTKDKRNKKSKSHHEILELDWKKVKYVVF